ncbi:hypothetical protein IEQ34_001418 [Dendrobium chrysotoxum]|uniref:Gamma-tubulin complex component n=1 Tax=Dendrobium chrysotoxum TaxID=161865 RepID=A0AAV7H6S8_DENCH|nr:hypothetical protein IEQ34_001418 [Dendrobium chrysotoxum]
MGEMLMLRALGLLPLTFFILSLPSQGLLDPSFADFVNLGWLFRKVRGYFLESIMDQQFEVGTVGQAFCSALQDELSDYYKLLAVLESQSANPIPSTGSDSGGSPRNYLSMWRPFVWLAEPMVRMCLMVLLVNRCQELIGGAMAELIHAHAQHGDPLVQEVMGWLLRRVCSPFEMKILRTGKSINFLRVCCEDSGWAKAAAHVGVATRRGGFGYGETDALEALAVEAAKRIDRHLMDVIHKRYRFKDHCLAIKRYLLLGQGDFVQYLMDIVGPELSEPTNTINSFQLAGLLETTVRASNAQYDDHEILDRLKVRLMDRGDGKTELNDNYNVGIEDVSITGVQMIDVQSTDKAYPMQRSQAVQRNATEGWDPKFVRPEDGKLIAVKRLSSSFYEKSNTVLFENGSLLKAVATNIENKIFDSGGSLSLSGQRASTESMFFDARGV